MAGKELYIEPILDANLSVIPGLSDNIAEMTAQLNETTRILTNVLANQGLEAHQEAYNGSAFSGLTLVQTGIGGYDGYAGSIAFEYPSTKTGCNEVKPDYVNQEMLANTANVRARIHNPLDVRNAKKIKIDITSVSGVAFSAVSLKPLGTGVPQDDIAGTITSAIYGGTAEFDLTSIPDTQRALWGAGAFLDITMASGSYGAFWVTIGAPVLVGADDSEETVAIYAMPKVKFNSVNALAFEVVPGGAEQKIVPYKVYITLPDIVSVGTWAVFLTNGNIDGATLALVDTTTKELVQTLPAATSDISSVTQTSNLSLSVIFASATNVIRSIAQRYY